MTLSTVEIESKSSVPLHSTPLTIKDFKGKAEPDCCPGCGDFGVLIEHFVKISQSEHQDAIGIFALDLQILLAQRGYIVHFCVTHRKKAK